MRMLCEEFMFTSYYNLNRVHHEVVKTSFLVKLQSWEINNL